MAFFNALGRYPTACGARVSPPAYRAPLTGDHERERGVNFGLAQGFWPKTRPGRVRSEGTPTPSVDAPGWHVSTTRSVSEERAQFRALVVDPSEEGQAVSDALGRHGIDHVVVPDAGRAVKSLDEAPFAVVISSLMLDGLSGTDLCQWVKARNPSTIFIALVDWAVVDAVPRCLDVGAWGWVPKPVCGVLLIKVLDRAIGSADREREMEQLRAQLVASQRMGAIGRVAASVANEINNPTGVVLANLTLIREQLPGLRSLHRTLRRLYESPGIDPVLLKDLPPEGSVNWMLHEVQEMLDDASTEAARVSRFSRDLESCADVSGVPELVRLDQVLQAALTVSKAEIRQRAELEVRLDEVPFIEARAGVLTQVLVNLLMHVIQAIPEEERGKHLLRVSTRVEGRDVLAVVEDMGIDAPVVRIAADNPSSGLSVCAQLVKLEGGSLQAARAGSSVASLAVRFPAVVEEARRMRVLVISENRWLLRVCHRALDDANDVVLAASAIAGARLLKGDRFDAVVCDGRGETPTWPEIKPALADDCSTVVVVRSPLSDPVEDSRERVPLPDGARSLTAPFTTTELIASVEAALEVAASAAKRVAPTTG